MGTPKGRLNRYEKDLTQRSWQKVRDGVAVKLLPQEDEVYILAQSQDRILKERSMRRRQLKRLGARLHQLKGMALIRDELLLKLGAAKQQSPSALILNDFFLVFTANPLSRANAPLPIAFAKRGLQNFYKWDLSQSLDYEAYVLELTLKMQDFKEGFTAFLEKRDPIFKGE